MTDRQPTLALRPVKLTSEALPFVRKHHRHSSPPAGHRFSFGVEVDGELVGVAIVGRPNNRHLDDGYTAEVSRCCTIGTRNACSMLYGAARRAAKAQGYRHLVTYKLKSEDGASLKAAGFRYESDVRAEKWDRPSRPRGESREAVERERWGMAL